MPVRKKTGSSPRKSVATEKKGTGSTRKASAPARKNVPAKGPNRPTYIVGIGSSAGGLEALKEFFEHMPGDSGMAFVLVSHLDPTRKSIMAELLQKHTSMPVSEARDGARIMPDSVHIIPPDKMITIGQGILHVSATREERAKRHPIDHFFRSLALDQEDNAIGIILSGTGTEGVLGIKAIKGEGGLVIVQDPASAKYDGMPQSSIGTGLVDFILPPQDIPGRLIRYSQKINGEDAVSAVSLSDRSLQKIFLLIRSKTGHDFSLYKPKTIARRIERRMTVHQIDTIEIYLRYLLENPEEINALFKDLLIRVTSFFRDPEAFAVLAEKVLPFIIRNAAPAQSLRIWVPACSTGEEAYSIAMVVDEYVTSHKLHVKTQIFATDIDSEAVECARTGKYPLSIAADVSAERLQRYFTKVQHYYLVNTSIREKIVFAIQDTIKDPPLSRMDLICCRNLLIYFNSILQKKLLAVFHYALKPGGILFLGASETIGSRTDLFTVFHAKWRFFKPLPGTTYNHDLNFPALPRLVAGKEVHAGADKTGPKQPPLDELTRKMLLDMYAPACVVIREDGDILYFYGRTGNFLEPAPGQANLNIFSMARSGLKRELLRGVKTVKAELKELWFRGLQVKANATQLTCNLRVIPIRQPENMKGLLMVVFEVLGEHVQPPDEKTETRGPKSSGRIEELEFELESVKEYLQTTIEELETANEELQSANEELQSTNEELETSREELQSVNEELMTVNAEAQEKIELLTRSANDMRNLLASTDIATVFLDQNLRIKSFTPAAVRIFKLIASDIGRPISDIANTLRYDNLMEDMQEVLESFILKEQQILDSEGFWYLLKIMPYRTEANTIEGVVLSLVDITKQKHAEAALVASEERRDSILGQTGEGFILIDLESGSITDSNPEFQKMTGRHGWELKEMKVWDLVPQPEMAETKKMFRQKGGKVFAALRTMEFLGPGGRAQPLELQSKVITIVGRKYIQCFVRKAEK